MSLPCVDADWGNGCGTTDVVLRNDPDDDEDDEEDEPKKDSEDDDDGSGDGYSE